MAETWKLNLKPTPKSKPTDKARIFLDMARVQPLPDPPPDPPEPPIGGGDD